MSKRETEFRHQFDGASVLEELLALAGSPYTVDEVIAQMQQAQGEGIAANTVIPTLFEGEPRFENPEAARLLFQNLLGLWDLISSGRPFPLEPEAKPIRPRKAKPVPPTPFAPGVPNEAFVEAAWRYLEDAEGSKELQRLQDAFENRQDALLVYLDEQGLSDEGYASARFLLFELFSMIELGWPGGTRAVHREQLTGQAGPEAIPAPLLQHVEESLFEAEQDEVAPVPPDELGRLRELVLQCARALWNARKR